MHSPSCAGLLASCELNKNQGEVWKEEEKIHGITKKSAFCLLLLVCFFFLERAALGVNTCRLPPWQSGTGGCVGEIWGTRLAGSVEKSSHRQQNCPRHVQGLSENQPVLCPHASPHLISSSCHSKACAGAFRSAQSWATRGEGGQRRWGWAHGLYHLQEGPWAYWRHTGTEFFL